MPIINSIYLDPDICCLVELISDWRGKTIKIPSVSLHMLYFFGLSGTLSRFITVNVKNMLEQKDIVFMYSDWSSDFFFFFFCDSRVEQIELFSNSLVKTLMIFLLF